MINILKNSLRYRLNILRGSINRYFYKPPHVLNILDSLSYILETRKSIARFGDGEFDLMMQKGAPGFQKFDERLVERLHEVLQTENNDLIIGIPHVFDNLNEYAKQPKYFWQSYMGANRKRIMTMLNSEQVYINTNMTRFYTGYQNKDRCGLIIQKYKQIWDGKIIVIIEGSKTRMGVGNTLFDNAKEIKRILCPATNAWDSYDIIMDAVVKTSVIFPKAVYILALGPTASILAYDMSKMGLWALDFGHLDIQYEYYLRKVKGKEVIRGKYVNENNQGINVSDEIVDKKYLNSILHDVSKEVYIKEGCNKKS